MRILAAPAGAAVRAIFRAVVRAVLPHPCCAGGSCTPDDRYRGRRLVLLSLAVPVALANLAPRVVWAQTTDITVDVDATDLDHRLFSVRETIAVRPGKLTLLYPKWMPGTHGPSSNNVTQLTGLTVSALGRRLRWQRDPDDGHLFRVDVPAGATALDLEFQVASPLKEDDGRVAMTRAILGVQWGAVALYPAGRPVRDIRAAARVRLPAGWDYATALRPAAGVGAADGWIAFAPTSFETLVDAPLFAGRHVKHVALDAAAARPVMLHIVADTPAELAATDEQIAAHRRLVEQADRLFASRHYAHYDFLLAVSDSFGRIGLEHHESSENGVKANYFKDWDKRHGGRDLLAHEYTHSWNGKFRRPRELWASDFNQPTRNSLLWLYEGQTQYWGWALAARSGLISVAQAGDELAQIAADLDARPGRRWRNLQDTTQQAIFSAERARPWRDWQRGYDYYDESLLIWLDADTLIRSRSNGQRSLDDFARRFFGSRDGELGPQLYTFDDIVQTLQQVEPYDWAGFLRERLERVGPQAPLDGVTRAGWRLAFDAKPSAFAEAADADAKKRSFYHSLGIIVREDGGIDAVRWDGPAFRAGVAGSMQLIAVDGRAYQPEILSTALATAKDSGGIDLLLKDGDRYQTLRVDYRDGPRYPKIERIDGSADLLGAILAPR